MEKTNTFIYKNSNQKDLKAIHNFQIIEEYWGKRKQECEKYLSKYC